MPDAAYGSRWRVMCFNGPVTKAGVGGGEYRMPPRVSEGTGSSCLIRCR